MENISPKYPSGHSEDVEYKKSPETKALSSVFGQLSYSVLSQV
jgi:hypothetical protein